MGSPFALPLTTSELHYDETILLGGKASALKVPRVGVFLASISFIQRMGYLFDELGTSVQHRALLSLPIVGAGALRGRPDPS